MPILPFLTFVFVSSFTPGPNNFMAISFANRYGFRNTISFCIGVGAGFFLIALLCSFFNRALIEVLPVIETPLKFAGVFYMLYLAYKTFTSSGSKQESSAKADKNLFIIGTLIQFINPKAILYGIAVVSTFLLPYYQSYFSYILFCLFLGIVGICSSITWSLFGSVLHNFLDRYQKVFNIVMGLLLVYSAFAILIG
ncbi:Cysteine/O-acetylserine efflux protein [Oceanobacillus oncorhynchi]|uniref:Cysteine/O-acetylserine efflux protein n=1 Tax=Oceanobacillus oncorhynchi TaxID=545501 RepID=A0A0A1MBT1_9BACI|nr:LysE family transporter [Oceanobacillus oncorhynchi]CEI80528.1 Cysteine/O-acetylserine efflux protein [Oceanobacillus oncorhynchi]